MDFGGNTNIQRVGRADLETAFPFQGDLPNPGIESMSTTLAAMFITASTTWEAPWAQSVVYQRNEAMENPEL